MKRYALIITILLSLLVPVQSWGNEALKGVNAYISGDYATVLNEFASLAEKGNPTAQF
jgi:hypothetical protein